jgi:hypothetical protein
MDISSDSSRNIARRAQKVAKSRDSSAYNRECYGGARKKKAASVCDSEAA